MTTTIERLEARVAKYEAKLRAEIGDVATDHIFADLDAERIAELEAEIHEIKFGTGQ